MRWFFGYLCIGIAYFATGTCVNAQTCADNTDFVYGTNYTTRQDGNHVYSYASTYAVGDYADLWQVYVTVSYYYNSVLQFHGSFNANPLSTAADSETATLQTVGPGTATMNGYHQAYAAACNLWSPPYTNNWSGYTTSSLTVSRPTRPDYKVGSPALWYLGPGVTSSGQYSATTVFQLGSANGAPETPTYVISNGASELSLSCVSCGSPTATALKASAGCNTYDVVVNTSYNGFLSDPFYLFINRPWNLVAANDARNGQWVYSAPDYNGYVTYVNYKTQGLCSTDVPMSNYQLHETFTGLMVPSYLGENWPNQPNGGTPGALTIPPGASQWADNIGAWNPNAPAQSLAICGNGFACIPQWRNPGVGPHTLVQTVPQTWFVGSLNQGQGARVQADVLQQFTDSGWHAAIVTPNP